MLLQYANGIHAICELHLFLLRKECFPYNNICNYLRKHCGGIIGIWCHAVEFAKKEGLHGLFSGMIISEMSEAEEYDVVTDKESMDKTNRIMFTQFRRLMDNGTPLHEIPERLKALNTTQSDLSRFNYESFYYV
jgi:hypothetical protein